LQKVFCLLTAQARHSQTDRPHRQMDKRATVAKRCHRNAR